MRLQAKVCVPVSLKKAQAVERMYTSLLYETDFYAWTQDSSNSSPNRWMMSNHRDFCLAEAIAFSVAQTLRVPSPGGSLRAWRSLSAGLTALRYNQQSPPVIANL